MDDLDRYVADRAARDPAFVEGFERGYQGFKLGALLRQAREDAGLTQGQVAERLQTQKSAISRIENQTTDIRLSTLQRYAEAVGRELVLELRHAPEPVRGVSARKRVAV